MPSTAAAASDIDPYFWLEQVESEESLKFATDSNRQCLEILGDPQTSGTNTYERVLAVLESNDRIPYVSQIGVNAQGERILLNFWKDASNPKGLLRQTTLESYQTKTPNWVTLLDVDQLAEDDGISWVYKGSSHLARSRDGNSKITERALMKLSRGGSDAVHIREFDFSTGSFVEDRPFHVPKEAKTRVSYKNRNVVWIGSDFGPGSLTDSGYPRTVREWIRGVPLEDSTILFEGEATDVSVGMYMADERIWGGDIYEVRYRSLTFYTSKYWVRKITKDELLSSDPTGDVSGDFVEVDIQDDASIDFLGKQLIVSLRSDWDVGGVTYKKGSHIMTDAESFFARGASEAHFTILFEPTERTAYEYHVCTKNFLILSTMDNVKTKLEFFKITDAGATLTPVGGPAQPQIRSCSVSPIDPYLGSDECWFTTSDYVTPTTLCLADATRVGDDLDSFVVQDLKALPPQYDASGLKVEQRTAISKDGTEIPYFIVLRKDDAECKKERPTLLYGYGGFEVSLGPHYIATSGLAWLERGGVYVEANIRGGGEFGPSWHQAALKGKRHKCYEDFIAVAEDLISSGVCSAKTLAARGGSNGGLLMGNMYTMRPDLFGAIHCAVPLLDMKRYHTLLAGASWMAEYGNPDTDDWNFLQKYSPYHNIDPNETYPPILVTTSTRDDRVHPGHARKFVKKLQDLGENKWPVYYYENIEGGHGGAADAKQSAFMTALAYDFMFDTLTKNLNTST